MATLIGIAGVILGIGFLIFIHELGHFAVAKWADVQVEKFSIGFGPAIWQKTIGETTYALSWIPLGGYVQMLFEDANPDDPEIRANPRTFPNKSVNVRMAIMSAGVVMNIIFGLFCFAFLYGSGVLEQSPTIIGNVQADSPAYEAGLLPGDEIIGINGIDKDLDFDRMSMIIMLSGHNDEVKLKIQRRGVTDPLSVGLHPRANKNDIAPRIGVVSMGDTALIDGVGARSAVPPYIAPPGALPLAPAPGSDHAKDADLGPLLGFQRADRIVAAGPDRPDVEPTPVADLIAFRALNAKHRSETLKVVVERKDPSIPEDKNANATEKPMRVTLRLPPAQFVDYGLRMTIAPITSIHGGSPAEKAGFQVGDTILSVNGDANFDPMRLPSLMYDLAGKAVTFEVSRPAEAKNGGAAESVRMTLTATPNDTPPWTLQNIFPESLDINGLGLAYPILPKVVAVAPDSPAAAAGIQPGDRIVSAKLKDPLLDPKNPRIITLNFEDDGKTLGWPALMQILQELPAHEVTFEVQPADASAVKTTVNMTAVPVAGWYLTDRGLIFKKLTRPMPTLGLIAAMRRGLEETGTSIMSVYYTIVRMFQGRVSRKAIGGPIMIFDIGKQQVSQGWWEFLKFLGILSINLAVVNFLPIAPLDGGVMLMLLGEKVRGRPLPESVINGLNWVGLLLVAMLMIFAIGQDILRKIFEP